MASRKPVETDVVVANPDGTDSEVVDTPEVKPARWQPLDATRASWIADHARPAVSECLCGCGGSTKGRFVPGHDATLKETLKATVEAAPEHAHFAKAALETFGW